MVDKFGEGEVAAPTSFNVSDSPIITAQDKEDGTLVTGLEI